MRVAAIILLAICASTSAKQPTKPPTTNDLIVAANKMLYPLGQATPSRRGKK